MPGALLLLSSPDLLLVEAYFLKAPVNGMLCCCLAFCQAPEHGDQIGRPDSLLSPRAQHTQGHVDAGALGSLSAPALSTFPHTTKQWIPVPVWWWESGPFFICPSAVNVQEFGIGTCCVLCRLLRVDLSIATGTHGSQEQYSRTSHIMEMIQIKWIPCPYRYP